MERGSKWVLVGAGIELVSPMLLLISPWAYAPVAAIGLVLIIYGLDPAWSRSIGARILPDSLVERWFARPKWSPLGEAVKYIARESQWSEQQPRESLYGALLQIRMAAADGEITIKGRKEQKPAPNAYTREPRVFGQVPETIPAEYWLGHEPIFDQVLSERPGWQKTETEPENSMDIAAAWEPRYAGLRVKMPEIKVRWPKAGR